MLIAGVIDYNFLCFRDAITQVFELRNKAQNAAKLQSEAEDVPNGARDSPESADHLQPLPQIP